MYRIICFVKNSDTICHDFIFIHVFSLKSKFSLQNEAVMGILFLDFLMKEALGLIS